MHARAFGLLLALSVGTLACSEDDTGALNDVGQRADGGTMARDASSLSDAGLLSDAGAGGSDASSPPLGCDPTARPIPGGGATGGAIAGKATVFVLTAETAAPIVDGTVVLELAARTLTNVTDASGCVRFEGGDVVGPAAVHVFVGGRVIVSI